jgi:hypothetical protein
MVSARGRGRAGGGSLTVVPHGSHDITSDNQHDIPSRKGGADAR